MTSQAVFRDALEGSRQEQCFFGGGRNGDLQRDKTMSSRFVSMNRSWLYDG